MRISFGDSSCRVCKGKSEIAKKICDQIKLEINLIKKLSYEQIDSFKSQESKVSNINSNKLILTIYKEKIEENKILIVVQGFYPTWIFPNYISINGVGKMYADGVVVSQDNAKVEALAESLFSYW